MSPDHAQQLVVGALSASAVVAAGSLLAQGQAPSPRMLLGVGVTGIGLATCAMYAPDIAGSLATLILTGTLFYYGEPFMLAIVKVTGTTDSNGASPT